MRRKAHTRAQSQDALCKSARIAFLFLPDVMYMRARLSESKAPSARQAISRCGARASRHAEAASRIGASFFARASCSSVSSFVKLATYLRSKV